MESSDKPMETYEKYITIGYKYILKHFERIGYKLAKMNLSEKKEYLTKKINKLGEVKDYEKLDDKWMQALVDKCLSLYDEEENLSSMTTQEFIYFVEDRYEFGREKTKEEKAKEYKDYFMTRDIRYR